MRIGSMTAAAFTFARTIDSKKPEGNRGDVGQAQLCSVSTLLMELAKLCCSRAPLDGRCPAQIQPPGPEPQTRQFDPLRTFRIGPMNGREERESSLRLKAWGPYRITGSIGELTSRVDFAVGQMDRGGRFED